MARARAAPRPAQTERSRPPSRRRVARPPRPSIAGCSGHAAAVSQVRYLYKPLAPSAGAAAASAATFAFVALWHDVTLKLAVWGGLNAAFLLSERLLGLEARARAVVAADGARDGPTAAAAAVAATGAAYVLLLVGGNVVGYAVGIRGAVALATTVLTGGGEALGAGLAVVAAALGVLFAGVMAALAVRRIERAHGDRRHPPGKRSAADPT